MRKNGIKGFYNKVEAKNYFQNNVYELRIILNDKKKGRKQLLSTDVQFMND